MIYFVYEYKEDSREARFSCSFFMAQLVEMLATVSPLITTEAPLDHVNCCYFLGCWLSRKLKANSSNLTH